MAKKQIVKQGNRRADLDHKPSSKPPLKKAAGRQTSSSKSASAPAKDEAAVKDVRDPAVVREQQQALDVFKSAFNEQTLSSPDFTATLQRVKQALFERDFARAFGSDEYLAVYAARWSPTRALCYASILKDIEEHLYTIYIRQDPSTTSTDPEPVTQSPQETAQVEQRQNHPRKRQEVLRTLCIGGGAAELVAFGSFLQNQDHVKGEVALLDSADWSSVVNSLQSALTTTAPLSQSAQLLPSPFIPPERLSTRFIEQDVLTMATDKLSDAISPSPSFTPTANPSHPRPVLVTLLFTLNELFTAAGIGKTTAFLLNLTSVTPPGSLLLVVDSPGSYSETIVGSSSKKYPMQWLMDRVLLNTQKEPVEGRKWTKLESHDSIWFRLPETGLQYPIQLENMRYQLHLYRADSA
ncbi:hypothetical protein QBC46DRAFT_370670 [Diplogelasinospora grovesii]|uniref:25S rRNA (Uridine(2843)-N(3))-methyltransferase n=1 Tax=Diplogelasinospora grovesii TaxID=303347 RepID=A0AAN6SA32_9PEZI|nr:hypothetical protein QBC46DRAFT_370670 [Diplogelasinospora grovesii]